MDKLVVFSGFCMSLQLTQCQWSLYCEFFCD